MPGWPGAKVLEARREAHPLPVPAFKDRKVGDFYHIGNGTIARWGNRTWTCMMPATDDDRPAEHAESDEDEDKEENEDDHESQDEREEEDASDDE